MKTQVETKQLDNITIEPDEFKTAHDAYVAAKNNFANYLIFGNDVIAGIGTIEDIAGPPDRIFTYLETLKDFCIYKRSNNILNDEADIEILRVLGCVCTSEDPEDLKDPKVISYREFDNGSGSGQKELFKLHLKPNTFSPKYPRKTVRIYFKWEDKQKKVIVGWIGKHPFLP